MLKGLFIRRLCVALETLLLLVIFGAAVWVLLLKSGFLPSARGGAQADLPSGFSGSASGLTPVQPRSAYDTIIASGLFGSAAQNKVVEAAAPPPPPETETELQLQLCGTAATYPTDPLATAVIVNEENNTMRTYFIGQAVVEEVTLEEVFPRKVVLLNKKENRREILRAEDFKGSDTKVASASAPGKKPLSSRPAPPPSASSNAGERITVNRNELVSDVFMNYADIVTKIKPELYRDDTGNVQGITAKNIESIPLAKKLGVREGDVLQTVNNEMIDSEAKIMELAQKYRNANMVRIGLLRDGQPITVTYRLE